jgi:hypothetical protein
VGDGWDREVPRWQYRAAPPQYHHGGPVPQLASRPGVVEAAGKKGPGCGWEQPANANGSSKIVIANNFFMMFPF